MNVGVVVAGWARGLGVEVDALAGTVFGSINRVALVMGWHGNACVLRVGENRIAIADVTDLIIEHDEEFWTAVDAQPAPVQQS